MTRNRVVGVNPVAEIGKVLTGGDVRDRESEGDKEATSNAIRAKQGRRMGLEATSEMGSPGKRGRAITGDVGVREVVRAEILGEPQVMAVLNLQDPIIGVRAARPVVKISKGEGKDRKETDIRVVTIVRQGMKGADRVGHPVQRRQLQPPAATRK